MAIVTSANPVARRSSVDPKIKSRAIPTIQNTRETIRMIVRSAAKRINIPATEYRSQFGLVRIQRPNLIAKCFRLFASASLIRSAHRRLPRTVHGGGETRKCVGDRPRTALPLREGGKIAERFFGWGGDAISTVAQRAPTLRRHGPTRNLLGSVVELERSRARKFPPSRKGRADVGVSSNAQRGRCDVVQPIHRAQRREEPHPYCDHAERS